LAVILSILFAFLLSEFSLAAQTTVSRTTVSLDGTWKIADSVATDDLPTAYDHSVPVPGLAHSATPPFKNVDEFQSRQLLSNLVDQGMYSKADFDKLGISKGISHQERNYFWYRRTFIAPPQRVVALLKVNKEQFGIVVFLNGVKLGQHDPCFTSATFDATHAIRWGKENTLVIRVGAHPGVLPANVSEGTDFEKNRWTPGIYDDVSLLAMDNPVITNVQVAPDNASDPTLSRRWITVVSPATKP
jgi:beta-galactosidase